ncbi:MAG: cytochrome-c oxidase, cbb3-type subunit II [Dokdonella sp.]
MFGGYKYFEVIEKHVGLLGILIAIMVSLGGLAEITPLFIEAHKVHPADGVKPYDALRLAGKDIYVREGCYLCHSQMIRALQAETQRYGHYSIASESVYDRPFQWGSKRTGPDLARVGGKYSDEWQRIHLKAPRSVAPESNMPGYPWLSQALVDPVEITKKMKVLRMLGDPYTDADVAGAAAAVSGHTEMEAIIAYLQGLGIANEAHPLSKDTAAAAEGATP